MEGKKGPKTIDEYIATFPKNVQSILQELRRVIREAAPEAEESISYQMPTFELNGALVYFAAWKNHIGLYGATDSAVEALKKELSSYEMTKGTIKFPLDKPIPFDLIRRIVQFRVEENLGKKRLTYTS